MDYLDRFVYSPLGPSEIRLIKILPGRDSDIICCTLENVSWDDALQYETLSYVWGPNSLYASIILNGRRFLVRRNLWFALYYLRGNQETKTRTLREDEAINSNSRTNPSLISPENNDFDAQVTDTKDRFSIRSVVSRAKATSRWSSKGSEEMSSLESDMDRISVQQQPLADSSMSRAARIVWIDAICINQDDIFERNVQVQMMGTVYERATCVLIWLGEDTDTSKAGLRDFRDLNRLAEEARTSPLRRGDDRRIYSPTDFNVPGGPSDYNVQNSDQPTEAVSSDQLASDNWNAILEICYRSFWGRLWVIQEVVLSQKRLVICGNETLPWEIFESVLKTMVMDKGMASISVWKLSTEVHEKLMQSPAIKFFQGLKNIAFAGSTGRCSLRSLVTSFHGSITTDPRDQIYGFLGIAAPTTEVIADYTKTAAELYIDVMKASIWNSNYIDQYLVYFSELLQRALGNPFWNNDKKLFVHIEHELSIKKKTNQVLYVRAILGKRIDWVSKSNTNPWDKILQKRLTTSPELQKMLEEKEFTGSKTFQQITAFDEETNNSVFFQRFLINPYFDRTPQGGSALLSQNPKPDDYLCFFKDCNIAAVVRLKTGSTDIYVVVGRALVDQNTNFLDWTMECNVEFTLQSLQLLTR